MKILQLVHYYPPETFGGTQGYVAELSEFLVSLGHDVTVVAGAGISREDEDLLYSSEGGVRVIRIPRILPDESLSGDLGSERISQLVSGIVRDLMPDLVHVHHWHALSRDLVRRSREHGIKVVLTLHDLYTSCPRFFRMPDARSFCSSSVALSDCAECVSRDVPHVGLDELERILDQRLGEFREEMQQADQVLTVSQAQADLLESLPAWPRVSLKALPIGIHHAGGPLQAPEPMEGKLRLVNWAGLDPRKGIHVLLEALAESRLKDCFEIHLHGRDGEPSYMQELQETGKGLDLHFHGPFEDGEFRDFAERYDLGVFPFLAFETHGLVVDEALQSGLPLVLSDHGAPPERIGTMGSTFPPGDRAALRRVLESLVENPDRLAELRQGQHGAIDLKTHATELLKIYDSVL